MKHEEAAKYVTKYFAENQNTNNIFYNLDRTKELVSATLKLLENSEIDEKDYSLVLIAAWFGYIGFVSDYDNHVDESIRVAGTFLNDINASEDKRRMVASLLENAWSTKVPVDLETKVLRDAITAYYGDDNFTELIELHRMEYSQFNEDTLTISEWQKKHLELLSSTHRYYSEFAKANWEEQKAKNINKLVANLAKAKKKKRKERLKVKLKNESPERAIQSLYRTQLRNHIKLSDIADTKANILLSVNAIIISLLLANMIPKLDSPKNSYLIYPTVIFVIFSITSMIMSVLATRPKIQNDGLVESNLNDKETNFLFFGNFYLLDLPEFKKWMREIIKSKESIYDSLTMDLYFLGLVLKKKYQLLRWTYTVFIIGIILSVIAFAIALKYYGMGDEIIEAVTPER